MNVDKKFIFSLAIVAILSSSISLGAYSLLNREKPSWASDMIVDKNGYTLPVAYSAANPVIETDFTKAAEKTVNAVVSITSKTTPKESPQSGMMMDPFFEFFFGQQPGMRPRQQQQQPRTGFGSGVIISSDGYIVTNNHVIDGADKLEITLNDNRTFNARVVGADPATDLALLKVDEKDLPTLKFGNSDDLKIGEWVLAVGNPFGLTSTVTKGIVSAKARSIGMLGNKKTLGIESFIQTDAAVNPGNSGGALVNTSGELVGINTAIFSETGNFAGYSFAVPSSIVSKVITDLKQFGTVQRAVLGVMIRDINSELAKEKSLSVQEGVYIDNVNDRSSALEAGIKMGDVITEINGVKVKNSASLQEQVARYRPGDKIKIKILRGKENKELSVTLKNNQGTTNVTQVVGMTSLGAAFKELKTKTKEELNITNGVQVDGIINKGKFQAAGIRNGFIILRINDKPISSVSNVETMFDAIVKSNSGEKVMFITGIYPNGKAAYYAVDISEE